MKQMFHTYKPVVLNLSWVHSCTCVLSMAPQCEGVQAVPDIRRRPGNYYKGCDISGSTGQLNSQGINMCTLLVRILRLGVVM